MKKLIVRYSGGPLAYPWSNYPNKTTKFLSTAEADYLHVNYLNSIGNGFQADTALAKHDPKVIEKTSESVIKWARDQGYEDIYIVGSSNGASYAMHGAKSSPDIVKKVYLIVPFTEFLSNKTIRQSTFDIRLNNQSIFEYVAYGPLEKRIELEHWYKRLFNTECSKVPTQTFYGELDRLVDYKKAPKCIIEKSDITVVPFQSHTSLVQRNSVVHQIIADINSI